MTSKQDDSGLYRKTSDNISQGTKDLFGKVKNTVNTNNNNNGNTNNNDSDGEYSNLEEEGNSNNSNNTNGVNGFMNSKPKTIFDGAARGVLSLGSGFINGARGVIEKPIKGAQEQGVAGFFKGVAKGVSGAVILPAVGLMEFVSLSFQGVINTPLTILDAMKSAPKEQELTVITSSESKPIFFGVSLEDSIQNCKDLQISHIISICIEYIDQRKTNEGIFRINGSSNLVSELQKSFDRGEIKSIDDLKPELTYEICGIFKSYFRYLPEPIIPTNHVQELINIHKSISEMDKKIQPIKSVINSIQEPSYSTLYLCSNLLYQISLKSKENLMTASNLSIIFGVSWLRPDDTNIQEIANANTIIFILLSNFNTIFTKKPNLELFTSQ